MTLKTLGLLSALFLPALAFAESSEVKADLKDLAGQTKFEDKHEITDAKLRAEVGSLSRYSMKTSITYYGPILSDLGEKDQPNPDGSVGVYATSLKGSVSMRYRFDSATTLSLGTGLNILHPFHGADRTDLNNPYVSYDMSSKVGGFQMRHSPGYSVVTVPNYTKIGEYGSPNYYFNMVYDLGASGYAVALDANVQYFLYNREYEKADGNAGRYNVSFSPNAKYNINDKFNLSTSVNFSFWNPRARADAWAMLPRTVTQSLGLGYAYQRDVYFNPYLTFYPDNLAPERTTFNVAAIFSVL